MNKKFLIIIVPVGIIGFFLIASTAMYVMDESRYYIDTDESTDTTIEESTDTTIGGPTDTTIEESTDTTIEESTDTTIGGPIEPTIEESTDTTIEEPEVSHNVDESNIEYDDYTVLVYMVASDLEGEGDYAATEDLYEMRKVGSGNKINVIVESGGSYATSDSYRVIDFNTVKRLYIEREKIKEISDLGEQNMGDPNTLSDFLIWGTTNYPAKKYIVILWDHGSGFKGYGYDEIYEDKLSLDEINTAFSKAKDYDENMHFEVVGFDACLMASIEVAYALQGYTNYLVASEEVEPDYGWDYTAILSSLHSNHKQSGASIGKIIADSYLKHVESKSKVYGSGDAHFMITLSVIDMSKLDSLIESISEFGEELNQLDSDSIPMLSQAYFESERYGVKSGRDSGHTDIQSVANHIGNTFNFLDDAATNLKKDVTNAVVHNVHGISRPQSAGISIYIPITYSKESSSDDKSRSMSFNQDYQDYLAIDKLAPKLNVDYDGYTLKGNFVGDDVYSFKIFVTYALYNDLLYIMSTTEYNPYEFPNGNFELDWDKTNPVLCTDDMCADVNPEYEYGGERTLVHIPVKVQSGDVSTDVDLVYDVTDDILFPTFNGAWVVDKEEKLYQKRTIPLKDGDLIYPYIMAYEPKTGKIEQVLPDSPITVHGTLHYTIGKPINSIVYQYVQVCDYSHNCDLEGPFRSKV